MGIGDIQILLIKFTNAFLKALVKEGLSRMNLYQYSAKKGIQDLFALSAHSMKMKNI